MSRASVHTTVRELSHQISRRERLLRELWEVSTGYRRVLSDGGWVQPNDIERKQASKKYEATKAEIPALQEALSALCAVIGKGLL